MCVQSVVAVSDINYISNSSKDHLASESSLVVIDSSSESSPIVSSVSSIVLDNGTNGNLDSESSSDFSESSSDFTDSSSGSSSNDFGSNSSATINNNSNGNGTISNSTNTTGILQKPQSFVIPDNASITSAYIQNIIDDATPGSTIQFAGSFYKNLNLKVNKPLNIISKSATVINMTFNLPVFTILKGGSGTNISGFTANIADSFVEASDVSNIGIRKNKIFTKRTAIVLENVFDSKIESNQFLRFKTAIDISKSGGLIISKNNITPDASYNTGIRLNDISSDKEISILNNRIIGFDSRRESTGIHCGANVKNLLIQGNIINEWYTAINFTNSLINVSILNNTLRYNGDGVVINGWMTNFTFKKNIVTNTGRIGVHFDDDYRGTRGSFVLEKNFFTKNGHLDLKNTGADELNIGENFAKFLCNRIKMKNGYSIKTRQKGNEYYFSVVDKNGRSVSGLPNFSASINIGGTNYDVFFVDSMAYFEYGGSSDGDAVLDVGEDKRSLSDWGETQTVSSLDYYKKIYQDLINSLIENQTSSDDGDYNNKQNNQRLNDNNGTGSSASNGNGGGDSGISDGSSSVSSNSNAAGSSGSSSVSPSSSSPASSPASPDSATIKSLSLDEETFRVAGVGGLIFLIICVIGLYYREDILEMIKE